MDTGSDNQQMMDEGGEVITVYGINKWMKKRITRPDVSEFVCSPPAADEGFFHLRYGRHINPKKSPSDNINHELGLQVGADGVVTASVSEVGAADCGPSVSLSPLGLVVEVNQQQPVPPQFETPKIANSFTKPILRIPIPFVRIESKSFDRDDDIEEEIIGHLSLKEESDVITPETPGTPTIKIPVSPGHTGSVCGSPGSKFNAPGSPGYRRHSTDSPGNILNTPEPSRNKLSPPLEPNRRAVSERNLTIEPNRRAVSERNLTIEPKDNLIYVTPQTTPFVTPLTTPQNSPKIQRRQHYFSGGAAGSGVVMDASGGNPSNNTSGGSLKNWFFTGHYSGAPGGMPQQGQSIAEDGGGSGEGLSSSSARRSERILQDQRTAASLDQAGRQLGPKFRPKPTLMREMNFWAPTSM